MDAGTTIMFRPELMKALMVGTAKTFEKDLSVGIIHLNKHAKEGTIQNEFDHIVNKIYPIKRANNLMKVFRKIYPVWSKHLQHGLFPERNTEPIYQQPCSEMELIVVDQIIAEQRERERVLNKDAQAARVSIPEDIRHYLKRQPIGRWSEDDFKAFEQELDEQDLAFNEWADEMISKVGGVNKTIAPPSPKRFKEDPIPTEYEWITPDDATIEEFVSELIDEDISKKQI